MKSGAGRLQKIIFNKPLALSVVTIYDNTSASGTKIGTITLPVTLLSAEPVRDFNCIFSTGLTIVTSGASSDITIIYI